MEVPHPRIPWLFDSLLKTVPIMKRWSIAQSKTWLKPFTSMNRYNLKFISDRILTGENFSCLSTPLYCPWSSSIERRSFQTLGSDFYQNCERKVPNDSIGGTEQYRPNLAKVYRIVVPYFDRDLPTCILQKVWFALANVYQTEASNQGLPRGGITLEWWSLDLRPKSTKNKDNILKS